MSLESNHDRNRMDALLDALAEDEKPDPVGEGRRFLLDTLAEQVRHAIHDEPDPMLEEIERHDEWLAREGKDVWNL